MKEVATIVAAYVGNNPVAPDQLPALIASVSAALSGLDQPAATPAPLTPAVSIKQSLRADHLVCLSCGQKSKMLKRHLGTAHGMTPDEYRATWNLPKDYPMVARDYAVKRSELARAIGLGTRGGRRPRRGG
jgi:predicted transcriptional regulator